jgi:hypothetical protein
LGCAVALGLLGDLLLRVTPWGVNLAIWVAAAAMAVWVLRRVSISPGTLPSVPAILACLFAFGLVWCDSGTLNGLALLAASASLAAAALPQRAGGPRTARLSEYADAAAGVAGSVAVGPVPILESVRPASGERGWATWTGRAVALGRGALFALPLLFLFGVLLASADDAFAAILEDLFHFDLTEPVLHLLWTLGFAWLAVGLLRETVLRPEHPPRFADFPLPKVGVVEIATVLALTDLLFLGFVIVQVRYLFGGASLIELTPGLTYAEYARNGFFELVVLAALVLPILLLADALVRDPSPRARGIVRALAAAQVALLFVIMASAAERMRLYQAEFGWTEQRLYASAFIGWLAVVFAWFVATVLRGDRTRFTFGAWTAGLAAVLLLHLVNPDAWIVRQNVERAAAGHAFDAAYVSSLSDDAVPTLLESLPSLETADRCVVAQSLLFDRSSGEPADWRTWNAARWRAHRLVQERRGDLLDTMIGSCVHP